MKATAIVCALLFSFGAAEALSQSAPAQAPGKPAALSSRVKQADTNGDGMISREEAKALPQLEKHFDEVDANHDGQVTAEEIRAYQHKARSQQAAARFKKADTNGDGKISRDEAKAGAPGLAKHFDEIDTNKDGFLTPDEIAAARSRRQQQAATK